jgi:1-acyl-sn-glycerol-3-phosphate acyltransferase
VNGRIDYRSIDYGRWTALQRVVKWIASGLLRLVARVSVRGLENIPPTGAVLVASNHLSMLDVLVILTILPRRGVCIATDTMQHRWWARWFLDLGDTIWIRRGGGDLDAVGQGVTVLRAGGLLGVAPEGGLSRTGGLMRGKTGLAYLAAEAPAPVVPLVAWGQEHIPGSLRRLRRTRVQIRVGAPITIPQGEKTAARLQHHTDRVMIAMAELLPPEYRGVYARELSSEDPSAYDPTSFVGETAAWTAATSSERSGAEQPEASRSPPSVVH